MRPHCPPSRRAGARTGDEQRRTPGVNGHDLVEGLGCDAGHGAAESVCGPRGEAVAEHPDALLTKIAPAPNWASAKSKSERDHVCAVEVGLDPTAVPPATTIDSAYGFGRGSCGSPGMPEGGTGPSDRPASRSESRCTRPPRPERPTLLAVGGADPVVRSGDQGHPGPGSVSARRGRLRSDSTGRQGSRSLERAESLEYLLGLGHESAHQLARRHELGDGAHPLTGRVALPSRSTPSVAASPPRWRRRRH